MNFVVRENQKYLESYTTTPIKAEVLLDANESPYNIPAPIREEILEKIGNLPFNRYPEMTSDSVRTLIAEDLQLTKEQVYIGNGSSSLLGLLANVFGGKNKKILYPTPSFSMYTTYVHMADSQPLEYILNKDFSLDKNKLLTQIASEQPSMIIFCNPNNPTGTEYNLSDIEEILSAATVPVVVDEAYIEFGGESAIKLLERYENLIVVRTFSKAYSLASMRIGYAVGSENIMQHLSRVVLPYQINAVSLIVAECIYKNKNLYKENIADIVRERTLVQKELKKLGLVVYPSATNFLAFSIAGDKEKGNALCNYLLENSVAVRNFTQKKYLEGIIRQTIGTPEENEQALAKIKEFLKSIAVK